MSYDRKFRERALEYWATGHSKRATAIVFKVSASTLQGWKSQLKENGSWETRKRSESWRKIEPARLRKHIKENPDAYLREIAEEFDCSINAISKALIRLKISRKKNYSIPGKK